MSKWIYDLNTDFQAGKEITSATQFAEIPTFVSKGSREQLHEGFAVFPARVRLGESHVLLLIRRQLADVENWGRITTKTCKNIDTSKIHWLSQLWPTAPIYCDCERNTSSDVIATSYDRDSDCGRWWKCTPPKYVFDVTSIGRRSSPWTCNSESRDKCSPRVKLHCPSAQLMLRRLHSTNLSESIEAKYWVSWLRFGVNKREYELWKLPLNSSFCAVTADPKPGCPHGRKACFRGVVIVLMVMVLVIVMEMVMVLVIGMVMVMVMV